MLSVIIPAYNEEASIAQTIVRLRRVLDAAATVYEIIVIDDGSSDHTAQAAEATGARVVRHPVNAGYGRAIKTGMSCSAYEWCAIVDADGSYPVERFPDLLAYIPRFDMVVGARTGRHYWGSLGKRIGRIGLARLAQYIVGRRIPDINSGMRVFRKAIAQAHLARISSGFSFTSTLTLAMFLEDHFVKYVPIEYHPRVGSSKVKIGFETLRMFHMLVQSVAYHNPLKLVVPMGVLGLVMGLGVGGLMAASGAVVQGIALMTGAFLVSLLIGGVGLLAETVRLSRPPGLRVDVAAESAARAGPRQE